MSGMSGEKTCTLHLSREMSWRMQLNTRLKEADRSSEWNFQLLFLATNYSSLIHNFVWLAVSFQINVKACCSVGEFLRLEIMMHDGVCRCRKLDWQQQNQVHLTREAKQKGKKNTACIHKRQQYLSNRPRVSVSYEIFQKRVRVFHRVCNFEFFECSTNIPSGLSAYNTQKPVVYCFHIIMHKTQFSRGFTGTITHSRLTNQSACIDLVII